jgi:hypothetical protein
VSTADRGHVGHLTLLTAADTRPTPADRDLTGALVALIARAVDRLPTIACSPGSCPTSSPGRCSPQQATPCPLPGVPTDPVLAAGSPVVAEVVERLAVGDRYATFLHPALDAGTGALRQVTALDCSNETADRLRAAVLLSPEPDLHGLSRQDLHVLGLSWPAGRTTSASPPR